MFDLMVGAGLRVGEVASLRLDSLDHPLLESEWVRLRMRGKGDKERFVWLTPPLYADVQHWLQVRPPSGSDQLFLNWRGDPITVAGIQYCLKGHCEAAGVTLSCRQLRHTFARCLAEGGMPVDSLAKLLGHNQLHTTQRYIDGADPTLRTEFKAAMAHLEAALVYHPEPPQSPPAQPRIASQVVLKQVREQLTCFPPWLREAADAYLTWRWPTWRAQTAKQDGVAFISCVRRIWVKIKGELAKLGHKLSRETIANILARHDLLPAPEWGGSPSWRHLMTHYKDQFLACDFFTVETLFLQTIYVLFFIEVGSQRVHFGAVPSIPMRPGWCSKPGTWSRSSRDMTRLCAFSSMTMTPHLLKRLTQYSVPKAWM